jgi:hypothetical protein
MRSLYLFIFSAGLLSLTAQRANIWHFGSGAGLNFNNNPPTVYAGGTTSGPDNSSSISDKSGNLLFYTDGVTIWNKNHVIMANGTGLSGHSSAGQCALIVPMPCDSMKYVVFHVTEFASPGNLSYSVVDMSLGSGLGAVVSSQKNISLGTGWTEKLCAYYNPNGRFYWLVAHKWNSDQFVAFKITSSSIATTSVVTGIGSVHNCGTYGGAHDAMGQLTISPDGSKIVNALTCKDVYELFDFNLATGVLSNSMSIPGDAGKAWGTAFSPDSRKLYVDNLFGQSVYQYDLTSNNLSTILSSKYTLITVTSGGYNFGYMELGPDNKVYIAHPSTTFMSVVNAPNNSGSTSNFSLNGQSLGSNSSSHSTSRIAYNIPNEQPFSISISSSTSKTLCSGQVTTLTAMGATSYTWSNSSTASSFTIKATTSVTFTVVGSSTVSCNNSTASISLVVTECLGLPAENEKAPIIYPNPGSDNLFIRSGNEESIHVTLISSTGQLVRDEDLRPDSNRVHQLRIADLPQGIYLVRMNIHGMLVTSYFLKE